MWAESSRGVKKGEVKANLLLSNGSNGNGLTKKRAESSVYRKQEVSYFRSLVQFSTFIYVPESGAIHTITFFFG